MAELLNLQKPFLLFILWRVSVETSAVNRETRWWWWWCLQGWIRHACKENHQHPVLKSSLKKWITFCAQSLPFHKTENISEEWIKNELFHHQKAALTSVCSTFSWEKRGGWPPSLKSRSSTCEVFAQVVKAWQKMNWIWVSFSESGTFFSWVLNYHFPKEEFQRNLGVKCRNSTEEGENLYVFIAYFAPTKVWQKSVMI